MSNVSDAKQFVGTRNAQTLRVEICRMYGVDETEERGKVGGWCGEDGDWRG